MEKTNKMNMEILTKILGRNQDLSKLSQAELDAKCLDLETRLNQVFGTLAPREQKVIRERFGFDDGRIKTLEEIGKMLNTTREIVFEIEKKAIRKLRHPLRSSQIPEFFKYIDASIEDWKDFLKDLDNQI